MTQPTSAQTYYSLLQSGELGESQRKVLKALIDWGAMTGSEVNEALGTSSGHKRLSELTRMGLVREGTPRVCKVTGREAIAWELTGRTAAQKAVPSSQDATPSRPQFEAAVKEIRALIQHRKLYDTEYAVPNDLFIVGVWLKKKARM